jgi:hypothetical protein
MVGVAGCETIDRELGILIMEACYPTQQTSILRFMHPMGYDMLKNITPKQIVALICSIFIIIGTFVCIDGIGIILKANETYSWKKAPGVITSSEIIDPDLCYAKNKGCHVNIQYMYIADGIKHQSNSIFIGEHRVNATGLAISFGKQYLSMYPLGNQTPVYYDPKNPQNAVLQRGWSKLTFTELKLGILFAFGGILTTLMDYFVFQKWGRMRGFGLGSFISMMYILSVQVS